MFIFTINMYPKLVTITVKKIGKILMIMILLLYDMKFSFAY